MWSLWQYYKDIPSVNNNSDIVHFNEANVTDLFNFKEKITCQTGNDGTKDVEIVVPLKFLSNFWTTLEMPLINCNSSLILRKSLNCVIVSTDVSTDGCNIFTANLYVPVTTLLSRDNAKLLQQLK